MRRLLPFGLLGACLAVGVLPALATDRSVSIRDFAFTPSNVAVTPGGTVSWATELGSSMHNVHFDDQATALGPASSDFSASRTFDQEGTYTYHCDVHPLMRGTVYVNATGTVPTPSTTPSSTPSSTPSPSASPTPSGQPPTSPSPSPEGGGGGSAGSTTAPVTSFRVTAASGRRGVFLTVRLGAGAAVRVRGTLRRGARRVRRVTLLARPGRHRLKLPGRRLAPGHYKLTLKAGDLTRTVRFRVRR